jgi:hypothetical protein
LTTGKIAQSKATGVVVVVSSLRHKFQVEATRTLKNAPHICSVIFDDVFERSSRRVYERFVVISMQYVVNGKWELQQ